MADRSLSDDGLRLIRAVGAGRIAAGAIIYALPRVAARLFTGERGETAETGVFARGFGARDWAIGIGLLTARDPTRWLRAACFADVGDSAAVLAGWRDLDRRHRTIALAVSAAPALIEGWLLLSARRSARAASR